MRSVKTILLISILIILTISFATSPEPPPHFRYHVSGNVVCDTLSDLSNFTVVLYGKAGRYADEYIRLDSELPEQVRPISLTDTTGYYSIIIDFPIYVDSLKAAIIRPQLEPIFSEAFWVDTLQIKSRYKDELVPSGAGCSSCSVQPQSDYVCKSKLDHYAYYVSVTQLLICR